MCVGCVCVAWLVGLTCCAHMDRAHAGTVYTSHMEPVEENLLDFTLEIAEYRLGPWDRGVSLHYCVEQREISRLPLNGRRMYKATKFMCVSEGCLM